MAVRDLWYTTGGDSIGLFINSSSFWGNVALTDTALRSLTSYDQSGGGKSKTLSSLAV